MLGEALGFLIRKELHCRNAALSFFSPEKPVVTSVIQCDSCCCHCCLCWGALLRDLGVNSHLCIPTSIEHSPLQMPKDTQAHLI